ncbi:MAG: class I SAM-dependent methyltransferase [bacterium]
MDKKENEVPELKFNEVFKESSLVDRTLMDRKFYNKKYLVADFPRSAFFDRAFIKTLIAKYEIPRGANILDLGCGTGWYSHFLIEAGMNVTGLDFSAAGILRAKNFYGQKANWIVGDVFDMPFKIGHEFDVIFCCDFSPFTLVDEITEVPEITKHIFKYLKKKGIFIFVWNSTLSGKRDDNSVIIEFTSKQVRQIFAELGEIIGDVFTTNKQLFPLLGVCSLNKFVTWFTTLATKIHHRSVRLICGVRKN